MFTSQTLVLNDVIAPSWETDAVFSSRVFKGYLRMQGSFQNDFYVKSFFVNKISVNIENNSSVILPQKVDNDYLLIVELRMNFSLFVSLNYLNFV